MVKLYDSGVYLVGGDCPEELAEILNKVRAALDGDMSAILAYVIGGASRS